MKGFSKAKVHPALFLFLIVFFAISAVYVINNYNVSSVIGKSIVGREIAAMKTYFTSQPQKIKSSLGGSVLGCDDTSQRCSFNSTTPFQPVCSKKGVDIDMTKGSATKTSSGIKVSKNANIEILKVTYPLSPAGSKYVKDSRMAITKTDLLTGEEENFATYRNWRNQADPRELNSRLAPGDDTIEKDIADSATGAFAVNASVTTLDDTEVVKESNPKAILDPEIKSGTKASSSDPNPDLANKVTTSTKGLYEAPGDHDGFEMEKTEECYTVNPNGFGNPETPYISCVVNNVPTIANIVGWFKSFCIGGDDVCEKMTIIGIKIDDSFGPQNECPKGNCTNYYLNNVLLSTSAPSTTKSDNSFFVTTPCQISVNGKAYDIPCYWEMPMSMVYDIERGIHGPGDPTFYTDKTEYIGAVAQEHKIRSLKCI